MFVFIHLGLFFVFKPKTEYDMRISDGSSDVCSSDLCSAATPGTRRSSAAPSKLGSIIAAMPTMPGMSCAPCRPCMFMSCPAALCPACSGSGCVFCAIARLASSADPVVQSCRCVVGASQLRPVCSLPPPNLDHAKPLITRHRADRDKEP